MFPALLRAEAIRSVSCVALGGEVYKGNSPSLVTGTQWYLCSFCLKGGREQH